MLYMKDWRIRTPEHYSLGFEGDHLAGSIALSAPLPDGWDLKVDVERDGEKNTIQLQREGDVFSAPLTSSMLGKSGYYQLQVRGTCGEVVRHSNVFLAMVCRSIDAPRAFPDPLPSQFEQMERQLTQLYQHPPMPGEGVWLLWDAAQGGYRPSEIPLPQGIDAPEIGAIRVLDRGEYEALPEKSADTLYLIRG